MRMGKWAWFLLAAAAFVTGCGNFWQDPYSSSTSFTLTNSGNIAVSAGSSNTSTITVTPGSSFTGTVTLTCAVTSPSGAVNPTTCSLSSSSLTFSSTTAQTSTLTAATESGTTAGAYEVAVTGTSGSVTESTTVCVAVGTGSCSSASTSGRFYILNQGTTPQIVGESIASAKLATISGSPWTLPSAAYAMAIAPDGDFLCVSTTSGVYAYPISNGQLGTAVQVSPDQAYAIQVDANSSWLVEAIPASGGVTLGAIPINPSTGAGTGNELTASFAVTSAALQPGRMVLSPDNTNIFVSLGAGGTIVVPFNSSSPLPSGVSGKIIPVLHSNGSALSVAVDPSSRLFYIGETLANSAGTSGGLRAFTYASLSTSTLVNATGSPIASGGLAPNFILPVTTPDYVYVANGAGSSTAGNITGFALTSSGSTYSLTNGSSVTTGVLPLALALDSSDAFVFVVGSYSPYFDSYTFDSTTTGELDVQITSSAAPNAIAIVAAP